MKRNWLKIESRQGGQVAYTMNLFFTTLFEHFVKTIGSLFYNIIVFVIPIDENKTVYYSNGGTFRGNPKAIFNEWLIYNKDCKHIWLLKDKPNISTFITKANNVAHCKVKSLRALYHLATAKYWIFDTQSPLGILPKKETIYVQLWHGAGAFKKFGIDSLGWGKKNKGSWLVDNMRWDMLLCSSDNIVHIYSHAFGNFPNNKIFVSGLPREDFITQNKENIKIFKERFKLPIKQDFILYAPTFRDDDRNSNTLFEGINHLTKTLDQTVGLRLHPNWLNRFNIGANLLDFSKVDDLESLLCATDILITDYSSIIFDYSLLERPIIFYVPDLDDYNSYRSFYCDYETFVPGPIAKTKSELLRAISNYNYDLWLPKIRELAIKYHKYNDGKNSVRVLNKILSIKK